jgi:hypothetical protein
VMGFANARSIVRVDTIAFGEVMVSQGLNPSYALRAACGARQLRALKLKVRQACGSFRV